ncbi:hypothetical protein [Okeania sp. SIO1H2]|uniref:hypothetical protein n=1 Tax=Okeania sp. SIO1H2 TaxID=2607775 RepID=UPI00257F022D|nr:hypothetical protein [Okeania sp. SIO1H2]
MGTKAPPAAALLAASGAAKPQKSPLPKVCSFHFTKIFLVSIFFWVSKDYQIIK